MNSSPKSNSERILVIDMLRGVCIVEMMANHLPLNLVTIFAKETLGFISAAEGFVFLSGFVAGWTSRLIARKRGVEFVRRRFWARACQLYAIYCTILTAVLACVALGGHRFSQWGRLCYVGGASMERVWIFGMAFLHQPSYLDIFPMYCVFVLLVPLMIAQLMAGRRWQLLTVSGALWAASQFWNVSSPSPLIQFGFFNVFSWQLLFTLGVAFGYHRDTREETPAESSWVLPVCGGLCVALFVLRCLVRLKFDIPLITSFNLAEKTTLGALRLVNFAAMSYVLRAILVWPRPGARGYWAYRQLAFLGQHSLPAFSWSVVITYLAFLSGPSWLNLPLAAQICIVGAAIGGLWVPAWLHAWWGKWDLRLPAVFAAAAAAVASGRESQRGQSV